MRPGYIILIDPDSLQAKTRAAAKDLSLWGSRQLLTTFGDQTLKTSRKWPGIPIFKLKRRK